MTPRIDILGVVATPPHPHIILGPINRGYKVSFILQINAFEKSHKFVCYSFTFYNCPVGFQSLLSYSEVLNHVSILLSNAYIRNFLVVILRLILPFH